MEELSWQSLKLSSASLELIAKAGFASPTPIQSQTIPIALEGHDVIASAQTGTGKTASFVLPMVERFFGREGTFGLILAPTREIAQQIQATLEIFGTPQKIRSIVLIGGVDMKIDIRGLQSYPQIIVATPGRLCDHLDRGTLWLDFIEVVVLDEADRMLDMGFSSQLARIMEEVPAKRQTMLFSATISPEVGRLANKILHDPRKVSVGKSQAAAGGVEQRVIWMEEAAKTRELRRLLREETGSIIVFTRSKDGATRVWRSLHSAGIYDATYIHSDRLQSHRESALAEFKEGKYRILIATDVAGRGIHVDAVAHVVNYDLPIDADSYVHRIGRTGRAGSTGKSTTFATSRDRRLMEEIEKLLGKSIPSEERAHSESSSQSQPHSNSRRSPANRANPERPSRSHSSRRPPAGTAASDSHKPKGPRRPPIKPKPNT
ncbi:MAG: DEAD/DEAH box helicase [Bdellovibrionia bacterium]